MVKLEQTCHDRYIERAEQGTHITSASSITVDHNGGQDRQKNGGEIKHNGCEGKSYVLPSKAHDKPFREVGPYLLISHQLRTSIVSCGAEGPR